MTDQAQSNKILSSTQLSMLSREELVAQLLTAHEKIRKLEAIHSKTNSLVYDGVSSCPIDIKSQAESMFAYSNDNSVDSLFENSYHTNQKHVMKELQVKLKDFENGDSPKLFPHYDDEEFIVAYEYKGDFPSCDEDLSMSSLTEDEHGPITHPQIIINQGIWDDNDNDQVETFPLIPSPVLNTPPYEYIFLTKTNEAKYRIFLNQKLNKVFQEEIHKLQKREEEILKGKSRYRLDDDGTDDQNPHLLYQDFNDDSHEAGQTGHNMDFHNQNHLLSTSSTNGINDSTSNVIHCFDPSDVDLELKKIFTEKPPVTHKIVRRKSRRDRGSSVPAVDSYYGTRDLHKVGHASYFIPTLTDAERQAIGWKNDYHYGHWKYATLNVPNPKTNQISLHPHVELDEHNHNHSNALPQNPLHHHEINLSEPFSEEESAAEALTTQHSLSSKHHHESDANEKEDTLSFITLSGCSNHVPESCHIIPDKSTLCRILKWLLPCIKQTAKSNTSSQATTNTVSPEDDEGSSEHSKAAEKKSGNDKKKKSKRKKHHEIETLVEPSGKLNFPTSHTYISFATTATAIDDEHNVVHDAAELGEEDKEEHDKSENDSIDHDPQSHSHHHHGLFHWKTILSHHGTSHSIDSMSVVGGDVIESTHDYSNMSKGHLDKDVMQVELIQDTALEKIKASCLQSCNSYKDNGAKLDIFDTSSTESEDTSTPLQRRSSKKKLLRKLKPCRAFTKLLTLADLGYETDQVNNNPRNYVKENVKIKKSSVTSTETDMSTTEDLRGNAYESTSPKTRKSKTTEIYTSDDDLPVQNASLLPFDITEKNNDDHISSGGSGYPFSSLSISHQNSEIGSSEYVMETDSLITPSSSRTEQQFESGIETRFLDPKDLLLAEMDKTMKSNEALDEDVLPFVFDFYNSNHGVDANLIHDCGEQQDDQVIEWMGDEFVDDIEEGIGLLSSCLDTLLKHDQLLNKNDNLPAGYTAPSENGEIPEKVDGQHRITTLNDLDNKGDRENKNDCTSLS